MVDAIHFARESNRGGWEYEVALRLSLCRYQVNADSWFSVPCAFEKCDADHYPTEVSAVMR